MKTKLLGIVLIITILYSTMAAAHTTAGDTYVRVVSADPDTRTYTFRCVPEPNNGYPVDWFIYGERVGHNEAEFLDVPADEDITYTFQTNNYYHIGCLVVSPTGDNLWRGDIHVDLRTELFEADVIPLSATQDSVTLHCTYDEPYTVEWWVSTYWGAADEPTRREKIAGDEKTITYTPPGHGLYHPRCYVKDQASGEVIEAGATIEFFDNKGPYLADRYGIDLNNNFAPFDHDTWMSMFDGTQDPSDPPEPPEEPEQPPQNTSGHYTSVNDIPATCNGEITHDSITGGRTITCANGDSILTIEAWNKPGNNDPQYFEMYKKSASGSGITICLGETCIGNNGYDKSPNFPIGATEPPQEPEQPPEEPPEQPPEEPPHEPLPTGSVEHETATCNGDITSDTYNGARRINCALNGNSLSIEAWNKPGNSNPEYFEMYKKEQIGSGVEICLGSTCISNGGFARSDGFTSQDPDTPPEDPEIPEEPPQEPPEEPICATTVNDLAATCTETITQDDAMGSCRKITCGDANSITVLACDKPNTGVKEYFEMYRQSVSGTPPQLCIGDTCMQTEGYKRSSNFVCN